MKSIKKLKQYWLFLTRTLLFVQTTVVLTIAYFFIFVPFALVWKAFHLISPKKESFWTTIPQKETVPKDFYEQY